MASQTLAKAFFWRTAPQRSLPSHRSSNRSLARIFPGTSASKKGKKVAFAAHNIASYPPPGMAFAHSGMEWQHVSPLVTERLPLTPTSPSFGVPSKAPEALPYSASQVPPGTAWSGLDTGQVPRAKQEIVWYPPPSTTCGRQCFEQDRKSKPLMQSQMASAPANGSWHVSMGLEHQMLAPGEVPCANSTSRSQYSSPMQLQACGLTRGATLDVPGRLRNVSMAVTPFGKQQTLPGLEGGRLVGGRHYSPFSAGLLPAAPAPMEVQNPWQQPSLPDWQHSGMHGPLWGSKMRSGTSSMHDGLGRSLTQGHTTHSPQAWVGMGQGYGPWGWEHPRLFQTQGGANVRYMRPGSCPEMTFMYPDRLGGAPMVKANSNSRYWANGLQQHGYNMQGLQASAYPADAFASERRGHSVCGQPFLQQV
jgi:hypothetical protein